MTAMNIARQPVLGAIAFSTADENRAIFQRIFSCKPEEAVSDTVTLCEFALERADDARQLLGRAHTRFS